MARNINSLLNKKGWTGKEVGKALVLSLVHDIKHQQEPDYKPLFNQSDFDKMESSIDTERDYLHYSIYRDIYSGLLEAHNGRSGQYQQFNNGCYQYVIKLKDAQIADVLLSQQELIPYVMTEEQYNSLKERAETRLKGYTVGFAALFFEELAGLVKYPETAPKAIRDAIEATKEEAVTNEYILSNYNEVYELGYYQLADGTRSDQMTSEEWKERLRAEYVKKHSINAEGELASCDAIAFSVATQKALTAYVLFFNGIDALKDRYKEITGKEPSQDEAAKMMKAMENYIYYASLDKTDLTPEAENRTAPRHTELNEIEKLIKGELESVAKWHYYTEPPADLTKYDIIADSLCFYNGEETEDFEIHLTEFKADYPALYDALEAYIKELIPQAKSLKPSQYNKPFISREELAELGIEDYAAYITANTDDIVEQMTQEDENTIENFLKHKRVSKNGIIIAKEPRGHLINESGEYIDNTQSVFSVPNSFNIDNIDGTQRAEIVNRISL